MLRRIEVNLVQGLEWRKHFMLYLNVFDHTVHNVKLHQEVTTVVRFLYQIAFLW